MSFGRLWLWPEEPRSYLGTLDMVHAMDVEIIEFREAVAVAGEALGLIWEAWIWFMQWMMKRKMSFGRLWLWRETPWSLFGRPGRGL